MLTDLKTINDLRALVLQMAFCTATSSTAPARHGLKKVTMDNIKQTPKYITSDQQIAAFVSAGTLITRQEYF